LPDRIGFALALLLLLVGTFLRLNGLSTLPAGFNDEEIIDIRIAETARLGRVEVFYEVQGQGREGLYQSVLAVVTSATGGGLIGYRMLSVWAGLLALALMYALGRRLFGMPAGLAATALLAVGMLPVLLSRSVSREALLPLFVTAVLLTLSLALPVYGARRSYEPNTALFAALGLLLGIGFYIHPITFMLTLMSMIFILYLVVTRQPLTRRTFSAFWFAIVLLIVIATPYLISSLQFPALAGGQRVFDPGLTTPLTALARGLSGLFFVGDPSPLWNLPGRPLLDLVSGLFVIIGVITAVRYLPQPRFALLIFGLLLLGPPALITANSPSFIDMAALLPLLALLFGLGVMTLYRSLTARHSRQLLIAALAALMIFNVQWTARDYFGAWPADRGMQTAYHTRIGQLAHYLDLTSDDIPSVICTPELNPPAAPRELINTQRLALMMHRIDAPLRYADCGTGLIFSNGGERGQLIMLETDVLDNINPFLSEWFVRGRLLERTDLPPASVLLLDVEQALADRVGAFTTTNPLEFGPEAVGGPGLIAPPVRFGGNITFLGHTHAWAETYVPGDVVPVVTYWRVDGRVPVDLRLFTHIQSDPGARPAAQNDAIAVLPETLRPRDVFVQVTFVQLPYTIPAGTYSISIGAYEDNTDIRLNAYDGDQPRGTGLFLGVLSVVRPAG